MFPGIWTGAGKISRLKKTGGKASIPGQGKEMSRDGQGWGEAKELTVLDACCP